MSALELAAVVASALGVWLTGRRAPVCWVVMVLASALYGIVFWQARLYADAALQGVFALLALYGWWGWVRGVRAAGQVQVVTLPPKSLWYGVGIATLLGLAFGIILRTTTDDPLPLLDALLSAYSILGQVWMARRHLACWWLWIAIDSVYTGLFIIRDLYLTAALYAAFIVLAALGLQAWRKAGRAV